MKRINDDGPPPLFDQVPKEVWHTIFFCLEKHMCPNIIPVYAYSKTSCSYYRSDVFFFMEKELKLLSFVSRSWFSIIREFVLRYFRKNPAYSSWVLACFKDTLEVLRLDDKEYRITDNVLQKMTNLKELNLSICDIRSRGVENLTNLTKLNIGFYYKLDPECIEKLTNLESLNMTDVDVPFESIMKLPFLRDLTLSTRDELLYDGVEKLSNLTRLEVLEYEETGKYDHIVHPGLSRSLLPKSESELHDVQFALETLQEVIPSLVNLRSFAYEGNSTFSCLSLTELPDLSSLELSGSILQLCLEDLELLTNLTCLRIIHTNARDNDLKGLTSLSSLTFHRSLGISDVSLENLSDLEFLEMNEEITDNQLRKMTQLKSLSLCRNQIISDFGIMTLTKLTYLDLGLNLNITDVGVHPLIQLRSIRNSSAWIIPSKLSISKNGLTHLTNLVDVNIRECDFM